MGGKEKIKIIDIIQVTPNDISTSIELIILEDDKDILLKNRTRTLQHEQ